MTQRQNCDLLIRNAYVITVDARRRVFSPGAVAVRGHTLVAVGPDREVVQQMRAVRSIDAEGAVLHPGFIDAHNHVVGAGCRGVFANDADDPVSRSLLVRTLLVSRGTMRPRGAPGLWTKPSIISALNQDTPLRSLGVFPSGEPPVEVIRHWHRSPP